MEIRQIIIRDVADLHFTYGAGKDEFETWDGKKLGTLPQWVKLHLTLKGQPSQELEIPIHVAEFKNK